MTVMDTTPITPLAASLAAPGMYVLAGGTPAPPGREGHGYGRDTGPGPKAPVLRLAGDTDDEDLEPHICRSID